MSDYKNTILKKLKEIEIVKIDGFDDRLIHTNGDINWIIRIKLLTGLMDFGY